MEAIQKVSTGIYRQLGCGIEIHVLPACVQIVPSEQQLWNRV